ncbi:hypothetical protein BJX66DRAFT_345584 [Aspergillus keveii]|uniref:Major facilitator superfamily (MFS) profile domain-containing protein n=1 Tax=Aspergillus keveii TaxID=714993 RepID=A0ABR4FHJ9_9EURO
MSSSELKESSALEVENATPDTESAEDEYHLRARTVIAIITPSLAYTCSFIGTIGPGTTITQVTDNLGDKEDQSWIANVVLLPLIGFHPVWWFIVAGCASGLIGSVVSGTAHKTTVVIGGQALNGFGGSLVLLGIPAGLEITPAKYRAYTMAIMTSFNNVLVISAQLTAGVFAGMSPEGWRRVYRYSTIFWGVGGLGVIFTYYPPPTRLRRENSMIHELKSVDFIGIALLLSGVVLLVTALTWGGFSYPWRSAHVLSTLIIGSVLLVSFCFWETFGPPHGMIDNRFLETRNFLLLMGTVFVDGALLYGVSTYFPIEASTVFTDNNPFQTNLNLVIISFL